MPAFFVSLVALLMAMLPTSAQAAPAVASGCTVLQGRVVCVLDVATSANSTVTLTGTNLDAAIEMELQMVNDATGATSSRTYYKIAASNPAGATVQWAVPGTVTRAMLNAYTGPTGFKNQAERELGMSAGQATGTGQKIVVQDSALGGLTITAVKLYDVTRSRATSAMVIPTSNTNGWIPPTITVGVDPTNPYKVIYSAPSGMNTLDLLDITCSTQLNIAGCAAGTRIRAGRPTSPFNGTAVNIVAGSVTWSDTKVTYETLALAGKELKSFSALKGATSGTYNVSPFIYFAPNVTQAKATGAAAGQYRIGGTDFRLLNHLRVNYADGTAGGGSRQVAIRTGETSSPGVSVALNTSVVAVQTITINDAALIGRMVTSIDFYYRDQAGRDLLVKTHETDFFVNGQITGIVNDPNAAASVLLQGMGMNAIASVVFTLANGSTLSLTAADFDGSTFDQLKITDALLSGVTILSVVATTAADGNGLTQTMSFTLAQALLVTKLPPKFELQGPSGGALTNASPSWNVIDFDPISSLSCSLDSAAYMPCPGTLAKISYTGLSVARHTLDVKAAGPDTAASAPVTVGFETVAPAGAAITSPVEAAVLIEGNPIVATWAPTGGPVTSTICWVDYETVNAASLGSCLNTVSLGVLGIGSHDFTVVTSGPGNDASAIASVHFTVKSAFIAPPSILVNGAASYFASHVVYSMNALRALSATDTFTINGSYDPASVVCRQYIINVGPGAVIPCTPGEPMVSSLPALGLWITQITVTGPGGSARNFIRHFVVPATIASFPRVETNTVHVDALPVEAFDSIEIQLADDTSYTNFRVVTFYRTSEFGANPPGTVINSWGNEHFSVTAPILGGAYWVGTGAHELENPSNPDASFGLSYTTGLIPAPVTP